MTRHRLDLLSLLLGLFFTTVASVALVAGWSVNVGRWLWPTVLITAGVVVLAAVLAAGRDRGDALTDTELDATTVQMADADVLPARDVAEAADPFGTTPIEPPMERSTAPSDGR
jgi:hypothetical protein